MLMVNVNNGSKIIIFCVIKRFEICNNNDDDECLVGWLAGMVSIAACTMACSCAYSQEERMVMMSSYNLCILYVLISTLPEVKSAEEKNCYYR